MVFFFFFGARAGRLDLALIWSPLLLLLFFFFFMISTRDRDTAQGTQQTRAKYAYAYVYILCTCVCVFCCVYARVCVYIQQQIDGRRFAWFCRFSLFFLLLIFCFSRLRYLFSIYVHIKKYFFIRFAGFFRISFTKVNLINTRRDVDSAVDAGRARRRWLLLPLLLLLQVCVPKI